MDSFLAKQPASTEGLNQHFESEAARRSYFREKLHKKLLDPEFQKTMGFPKAEIQPILELSDPPYYTACPNPFVAEFVFNYHKPFDVLQTNQVSEPYSGELRSSEHHPVYSFHPYHTKVPPEVIRQLIEYYTQPGDLVLDGFCGSGMTGVAARECGRHALLVDLSPAATFISAVNCRSHDWSQTLETLEAIIRASEEKWGYLYQTTGLTVNYYVWSDVFTCPDCFCEFPFFPYGVVHHGTKVETRKAFPCPNCQANLNVRRIRRVIFEENKKKVLAWVNAGSGKQRVNRSPNDYDLHLAEETETRRPANWFPDDPIDADGYSAKLAQLGDKAISTVSHFLSHRNLIILADLWERVAQIEDISIKNLSRATLTSILTVISERQGYFGGGGGMSGNLYMPIVRMEKNVYATLRRKLNKLAEAEQAKENLRSRVLVTNQSTTALDFIPAATIDYIYTDPPFGANIIYSEMNLGLEAWLKVKTNSGPEAVVDRSRHHEFEQYASLMHDCFSQYYRVLKPGHWLTLEFHNTSADVWNLLQKSLGESGFVVAGVNVFDKGSTTILADIRPGAAKTDLIISAYKPPAALEKPFELKVGTEAAVWDFVRRRLSQLPIFASSPVASKKAGLIIERLPYMLFDRMVAFHLERAIAVPLSASQFYAGLQHRFVLRDKMYFLEEEALARDVAGSVNITLSSD